MGIQSRLVCVCVNGRNEACENVHIWRRRVFLRNALCELGEFKVPIKCIFDEIELPGLLGVLERQLIVSVRFVRMEKTHFHIGESAHRYPPTRWI